jgi:hypothetical protein
MLFTGIPGNQYYELSGARCAYPTLGLTTKLGVKFSPSYYLARAECERLYFAHSLVRPRDSVTT